MIVVGINIALWFEGRFEDFRDAQSERQYPESLRDDLLTDLDSFDKVIAQNRRTIDAISDYLPRLDRLGAASTEEQAKVLFTPASYQFFQPADFTYVSMQESGDFRLLSDPSTKKDLLRLMRHYRLIEQMQGNFIQAMDDGYIPLLMNGFDMSGKGITDPELTSRQGFRNFFVFTLQDTEQRQAVLEAARGQAKALAELIEGQLH